MHYTSNIPTSDRSDIPAGESMPVSTNLRTGHGLPTGPRYANPYKNRLPSSRKLIDYGIRAKRQRPKRETTTAVMEENRRNELNEHLANEDANKNGEWDQFLNENDPTPDVDGFEKTPSKLRSLTPTMKGKVDNLFPSPSQGGKHTRKHNKKYKKSKKHGKSKKHKKSKKHGKSKKHKKSKKSRGKKRRTMRR